MANKWLLVATLILFPMASFAANTDAVLTGSTISVGGDSFTVSQGSIDSVTVSATKFTADLSRDAKMTITSSDKRNFTVDPVDYRKSFVCGSSNSTLTIENDLWDTTVTVTVTPTSGSTCSGGGGGGAASSGGGSTGGGGGGGGGIPASQPIVVPGVPIAGALTTPASTVAQPSPVALAVSPVFAGTLTRGISSDEVKRLQQLLNSDTDTIISSSGVGSPGNETDYFGSLTEKAVQKFQAKYGVVSSGSPDTTGYGLVGPATRAKLAEVFSNAEPQAPEVAEPSPVATAVSPVFTAALGLGQAGTDVKRLQQLLNSDTDTIISSSGVGSPGNETDYFGSLTEKAVQKFQVKYGVAGTGDPGYGFVGPKTRAKFGEIFSGGMPAIPAVPTEVPAVPAAPAQGNQADVDALEVQIQAMLSQLETLQAELQTQIAQ
ncbi:MAG: hypothetical protein COW88_01790 [Candidatus Lloydbacteria bacterium CG22_combo_CG10-13_8_21_14_all_47_15]|uniref:Peptidoglycan binding-like domain-containing protein n=1 Tax=Candidatus Lloydbacteria bacterium CG22_combo_CG10-13_8_21_14_all_47_15 TaxID=1974635 RepID=A0A2H0CUC0_9BACT|nr:MAG: hypothetical protein COW88_01790 [Candidatus Lloydbacteria bacterium CG22_combo_CG10-13_8_21_14_all_47_15]